MSSPGNELASERRNRASGKRNENLALLYQGLLTGIVRMQSGRQHVTDADSFRRRTKTALQEIERDAVATGYDGSDIRETNFAVVAFLDSVFFQSNEPIRAEWERKTLQEELFGQTDAGVTFFEKAERLRSRRDSQELADVLEVFLLCILLGFEGQFSGGLRGELYSVEEKLRARIEDIRGKSRRMSPAGLPPERGREEAVLQVPVERHYGLIMAIAVILLCLFFLAAKLQLLWASGHIRSELF